MANTSVSVKSMEPSLAWEPRSRELLQTLVEKGWDMNKYDTDMGDKYGESLLHHVWRRRSTGLMSSREQRKTRRPDAY